VVLDATATARLHRQSYANRAAPLLRDGVPTFCLLGRLDQHDLYLFSLLVRELAWIPDSFHELMYPNILRAQVGDPYPSAFLADCGPY
jgi:hypothetical protein